VNRKDEAVVEYQRFVLSKTCLEADKQCDSAREVLKRRE